MSPIVELDLGGAQRHQSETSLMCEVMHSELELYCAVRSSSLQGSHLASDLAADVVALSSSASPRPRRTHHLWSTSSGERVDLIRA